MIFIDRRIGKKGSSAGRKGCNVFAIHSIHVILPDNYLDTQGSPTSLNPAIKFIKEERKDKVIEYPSDELR